MMDEAMARKAPWPLLVFKAMRPRQWIKNLLLLGGLFLADRLFEPESVGRAVVGFAVFCALSGAIYLINDVIDAPRDRRHPRKRLRPIASGALSERLALWAAILATAAGLGGAFWLSPYFGLCALAYNLMMLAYSVWLKQVFLIDVMIIAMGFVIRAVSGVIVLRTPDTSVQLTSWFVECVMFLALLVAFCKRRGERELTEDATHSTRPTLQLYGPGFMNQAISICAAGAIISYTLYATSLDTPWPMLSTLPFVLFGIFRYLHLVYNERAGDAPELTLLGDVPLLGCVALWGLALVLVH